MAEVTREAVPFIPFDEMDQLQFLNGLMVGITEDHIEQAVEASNPDQLAEALPSTTATSTDEKSVLDAPETTIPTLDLDYSCGEVNPPSD